MNAIAAPRPDSAGSPDPALLLAAVQALPESLAIVSSGLMVYANPAWCGMFEGPYPSQLQDLSLDSLFLADSLRSGPGLGLMTKAKLAPGRSSFSPARTAAAGTSSW